MSSEHSNGKEVDDGEVITMADVLDEQSRMQEDATAVLGDSDELNCTYLQVNVWSLLLRHRYTYTRLVTVTFIQCRLI